MGALPGSDSFFTPKPDPTTGSMQAALWAGVVSQCLQCVSRADGPDPKPTVASRKTERALGIGRDASHAALWVCTGASQS